MRALQPVELLPQLTRFLLLQLRHNDIITHFLRAEMSARSLSPSPLPNLAGEGRLHPISFTGPILFPDPSGHFLFFQPLCNIGRNLPLGLVVPSTGLISLFLCIWKTIGGDNLRCAPPAHCSTVCKLLENKRKNTPCAKFYF